MKVELVCACENELGEGPIWDDSRNALLWVDAFGRKYSAYHPDGDSRVDYVTGQFTITLAMGEGSGLLVVTDTVVGKADDLGGEIVPIASTELTHADVRFNDGTATPDGSFFIGTMHLEETEPKGSLFRLSPEGAFIEVETGIITSNGQGFSPDRSIYYYTDTMRRTVWAYDYDAETGSLGSRRPFIETHGQPGRPDGLTVDSEGGLWVAMWEGFAVLRYDKTGKKVAEIPMPVAKPTSCAFGGPDLSSLYITSARVGLDEAHLAARPLSGGLFVVDTDTRGQTEPRFRG